ncbi:MAG: CinA family protein [Ruminococcaceae bacterium]|nr:CinA family protein [Oscillospiraceae bacterium]
MTSRKLATEVLTLLRNRGLSLATAESCTGGGVGEALTAIPGSSDTYRGGIISYTNAIKRKLLGVPSALLETYGAVSLPVAEAMALGAAQALKADVAVSTTGLAGPGGDDWGNPVGTVYIACAIRGKAYCRGFHFPGDREQVRRAAVEQALKWLVHHIDG